MDLNTNTNLSTIGRHVRLIAVIAILAAVVAYGASYVFSPSYGATTKVLVRAREARFLTSTGQDLANQPGVIDSSLAKSLAQTNAGLVASRDVAERVVNDLHLDVPRPEDTSFIGSVRSEIKRAYTVAKSIIAHGFYAEPATPFEAAVVELQGELKATPIKDSYLIEVKASADDPKLAAAIAEAATVALVDVSKARFAKDATTYQDFLKTQVDRAQSDVQAADHAIRDYKQANGITNVSEQLRLSAGSQEQVRQQLQQAEVDLDGAQAKRTAIQRSVASLSDTEQTTTTVQSGRSATTTTSTSPNIVYQQLSRDLAQVRSDIAALEARRDALKASLITPDTNSGVLPTQEAKLNELHLTLTAREDTFRTIQGTYQQAIINAAQGAQEISQADHATVPLYPERPVRWLIAVIGLILGCAAALFLAFLIDRRRGPALVREPPFSGPVPHPALAARSGSRESRNTTASR